MNMKVWNIGMINEQTGEEETHLIVLPTPPKEEMEQFAIHIANQFENFFEGFKVKQMACLLDEASDNMALDEGEWA